jgi:endonuclease/exonuclease/phosphatase family metal-dependent hydrolase
LRFRIDTWNCFGMSQGLSAINAVRAPLSERFHHPSVLAQCGVPDVLCVQELLSREAQRFFDGVGEGRFTTRFRDDNRIRFAGGMTMRGSGLGIGARMTLTGTRMRTFPGAQIGWDRLARKGALYTRLAIAEGITVDLVTVHLQAGYDARAETVRAAQLADLRALIGAVGASTRPFIVCGDFNIDGLGPRRQDAAYRGLKRALDGFEDLGATTDLATFEPLPTGNALAYALEPDASTQRVDYIFLRPGRGTTRLHCSQFGRIFDEPLGCASERHEQGAWASDHYGLTATFEY